MTLPKFYLVLAALAFGATALPRIQAQEPGASPAAAATPLPAQAATETVVYLRQDYMDSLKEAKLFDSNRFVAVFVRLDGPFVIFKQKGSTERIYIPTSAILYMRGPTDQSTLKY